MIGGKISYVARGSLTTNSCYEYNLVNDGTGYFQNCCTQDACNVGIVLSNSVSLLLVVVIAGGI
jgi:hypothetical protein